MSTIILDTVSTQTNDIKYAWKKHKSEKRKHLLYFFFLRITIYALRTWSFRKRNYSWFTVELKLLPNNIFSWGLYFKTMVLTRC